MSGSAHGRNPPLDLDNVYGDGPEASPELYQTTRVDALGQPDPGYLLLGEGGRDLPRNQEGRAIIGDPRNDENAFVSQLHLHFLHFHNAVLRMIRTTPVDTLWGRDLAKEPKDHGGDFEFARRMVRWHYQWLVVNDWLPRIIEVDTLQAAHAIVGVPQGTNVPPLPAGFAQAKAFFDQLTWIDPCGERVCRTLMPVEFSGAAFRFAHAQVRSRYDLNDQRLDVPIFAPRPPAASSFQAVPDQDLIDWARFFELDSSKPPQKARSIDTWMAAQLFQLPFGQGPDANLAFRNLRRSGRVYGLKSGQEIAAVLGVPVKLGPVAEAKLDAVAGAFPSGNVSKSMTPLWFYCLAEAEHPDNGGKLGQVGGLIVATTLLRLLKCDPESYVHDSSWQPVLLPTNPGVFTMADLVHIAIDERNDAFPAAASTP